MRRNPWGAWLVGAAAAALPIVAHGQALPPTLSTPERPDEPYQELPILTWQEELELQSTVRQVLFNAYLPLLARPTFYRGVHDDTIPNQMGDWNYQRRDVQEKLLQRADSVDAQRRGHAALPDAEINALIGRKQAFRPEQLEPLLTKTPRFEDLAVTVRRAQPLGGDWYRIDFDVRTKVNGIVETTSFDTVDIARQGGNWLLPTELLLNVAPLARAQQQVTGEGPIDPAAFAGNFIAIAQNTLKDILPFEIPNPFQASP